jgi:hypothetical protein
MASVAVGPSLVAGMRWRVRFLRTRSFAGVCVAEGISGRDPGGASLGRRTVETAPWAWNYSVAGEGCRRKLPNLWEKDFTYRALAAGLFAR